MRKFLSIFILVAVIAVPVSTLAQEAGDACLVAKRDAEREVSSTLWFMMGCLFGVFGVGAAYLFAPAPHVTGLVGKSAEYVAVYTDCYKDQGRNYQTRKAFTGCLIWTVVAALGGIGLGVYGCAL